LDSSLNFPLAGALEGAFQGQLQQLTNAIAAVCEACL
jgi:hypothetical protein